jgi:hypothetical protein
VTDGIHDESDRISDAGPTTLDIWLDTRFNRDGSAAACDVDAATPLTINSWAVVLRAVGGTFEWGPLDNLLPISPLRVTFAEAADTTDPVTYFNGWGGYYSLDPGRYLLGRLRVRVASGDPGIAIIPFHPLRPVAMTSFGTQCVTRDEDNTFKLGVHWFDADGIGRLSADPGGPYLAAPGQDIPFDGRGTMNPGGRPLTYSWDFGDGSSGDGPTPVHAYASAGEYTVTLTVSDGRETDSGSTTARIVTSSAPVARAGEPYAGRVGTPILFDGRGSYDPNGTP